MQLADSRPDAPAATSGNAALRVVLQSRLAWRHAFVEHSADRDDPALVERGNQLTRDLWPLMANERDDVQRAARQLLGEIAAPVLGSLLRAQTTLDANLASDYLRRRDDPDLTSILPRAATPTSAGTQVLGPVFTVWLDLARVGRAVAAPVLANVIGVVTDYDRVRVCEQALGLPPGGRDSVAQALVDRTMPIEPPEHYDVACTMLAGRISTGRQRLSHWLDVAASPDPAATQRSVQPWTYAALLALAGTEQQRAVDRAADVVLGGRATRVMYQWSEFFQQLDRVAAFVDLAHPAARVLLGRIDDAAESAMHFVRPHVARFVARDESFVPFLLDRWDRAGSDGIVVATSVALLQSVRGPIVTRVRTHFDAIARGASSAAGDLARSAVARALARDAVDAIDAVARCAGRRACLEALVAHADDTAAARAVVALGPVRLAALPVDVSHALVRRMLFQPTTTLAAAVFSTLDTCPRSLVGLREFTQVGALDDFARLTISLAARFQYRCLAVR